MSGDERWRFWSALKSVNNKLRDISEFALAQECNAAWYHKETNKRTLSVLLANAERAIQRAEASKLQRARAQVGMFDREGTP